MVRVLLVDNHDSFTYNLVQLIREAPDTSCTIMPHNTIRLEEVARFDKILFSPGPGLPEEFPAMNNILVEYAASKSILGVCLGHQAIACHFGGRLSNLGAPLHGIRETIAVSSKQGMLESMPDTMSVGLYHSWVVDPMTVPECFTITSRSKRGLIMSMVHNDLDVQGVQFHPESYMTEHGQAMIEHWLRS